MAQLKNLLCTGVIKAVGKVFANEFVGSVDWNNITNKPNLDSSAATLAKVYPVGAIYISTVSTSPATLFGFGTWERIGEGRSLIDCGSTYTAGKTGGSANVVVPYHTHTFTGTAVTSGNQSADHTHTRGSMDIAGTYYHGGTEGSGGGSGALSYGGVGVTYQRAHHYSGSTSCSGGLVLKASNNWSGSTSGASANHTHSVTAAGSNSYAGTSGNTTGANMPPYLAVYMWKRTA